MQVAVPGFTRYSDGHTVPNRFTVKNPMRNALEFDNYWLRKNMLSLSPPNFPVRRWWNTEALCDIESVYYEAIKKSHNLLDVGSGDLRLKRKIQLAGYNGKYETQDIGDEFDHTYSKLSEVENSYGAILCMDVVEHLPLREGLRLINDLTSLLSTEGVLVLQTPNARCIRFPLSTDMTHLHCYNIADLWAYLKVLGLSVEGFRVVFREPDESLYSRAKAVIGAYIATRLLGCDYADNILLIARKTKTQ